MRFRLGHPDYPAYDFYLLSHTADTEAEVNRLGPYEIITATYDWPTNEYPYHGWTPDINALLWPRDGNQFASVLLLIDEAQAHLIKANMAAQSATTDSLAQLQSNRDSLIAATSNIYQIDSILKGATLGNMSLDLALLLSAGARAVHAGGYRLDLLQQALADITTTTTSVLAAIAAATASNSTRPYLILRAMLSPNEDNRAAEVYEAGGMSTGDVSATTETELMAWKMYPLPPVRLPETNVSDALQGGWILPLVDFRYFWRLGPVGGDRDDAVWSGPPSDWPVGQIRPDEEAEWMPSLVAYPTDASEPSHYEPIDGNGTHPGISATDQRGMAADIQAAMQNWRVVCRDVRSQWNAADQSNAHSDFTGILCDYPDAFDATASYHLDAIALANKDGNRIAGGLSDSTTVQNTLSRKLRVLFRIENTSSIYEIDIYATSKDPESVDDLAEDIDGPSAAEKLHLPKIMLGLPADGYDPLPTPRAALVKAAKQWALLYFHWRRRQCYLKFPGIAPVIPNGHAHLIRWDLSAIRFETTYVAIEPFAGTDDTSTGGGMCCNDGSETAFVTVTSATVLDERQPIVTRTQIGLPRDWPDEQPGWAFNVIENSALIVGQTYLARRNIDSFLKMPQWGTRDCCDVAAGSLVNPPLGLECCPNGVPDDLRLVIYTDGSFGECPACIKGSGVIEIPLVRDGRFGYWIGNKDGCIEVALRCVPCDDSVTPYSPSPCGAHRCPDGAAYYWCLVIRLHDSTGPCVVNDTLTLVWDATEANCDPFQLPLLRLPRLQCDCDAWVGVCEGAGCFPGSGKCCPDKTPPIPDTLYATFDAPGCGLDAVIVTLTFQKICDNGQLLPGILVGACGCADEVTDYQWYGQAAVTCGTATAVGVAVCCETLTENGVITGYALRMSWALDVVCSMPERPSPETTTQCDPFELVDYVYIGTPVSCSCCDNVDMTITITE